MLIAIKEIIIVKIKTSSFFEVFLGRCRGNLKSNGTSMAS